MRIHQLSLRGITEAFREQAEVDFEALGPGLIAIIGENGVGKSTLIGSIYAALFRQLPGQKRALYDFCTHPEPEIDMTFSVNGERYRSLLKLDPKVRQIESYIFDGRGVALATGKKEAFSEWIGKHLGSSTLFLASLFSSQRRTGNFLGLERSQRKELFITQLLGLDRLRLITATAKGFADRAGRKVLELEGERKGIAAVLAGGSELEDILELTQKLEATSAELNDLEAKKATVEQNRRQLEAQESKRNTLQAQREELQRRMEKTGKEITRLQEQMAGDDRLLAEGNEVSGLAERERALFAGIETLHRQITDAQELETANREFESTLKSLEAELRTKQGEIKRSRTESDELALVPCGGKGPYASCVKIQRAIGSERQLPGLDGAVATLQLEIEIQRDSLVTVPVTSTELTKHLREYERERRKLDGLRKRAEELRVAAARRAEREASLQRLVQDQSVAKDQSAGIDQELEGFRELQCQLDTLGRQIRELDRSISASRAGREELIARKAQVEQQINQIEAARLRLTAVESELGTARVERDDFDYLAKVFGPDEIQLCEIQSAGPGVSAIVNGLLEGCFDNKFEVRFRTQRPKADGRGFTDDFDIEVRNKTLDRTCLVDELSGGQFVLVNEAVNLGIAIYNMRQGEGIRYETLFRDETVGALDIRNAREYVRMLRHAMDVGGFHQVIFICHQNQVWELADQVLEVRNGRVSVQAAAVR